MPRKKHIGRNERAAKIALAIGETLREARVRADLTQHDVATAIGVSRQLYGDIESGKRSLRVYQLDAIAKTFGVAPSTLVRRSLDLLTQPAN